MHKKISFFSAILITLNSIIGAGLFVNTTSLMTTVGVWGFTCYLLGALILLPIVLTIASLAAEYPVAGGLYFYSKKELGSLYGFLSGWSYFLAKTTSFALLSHVFLQFLMRLMGITDQWMLGLSYPLFFAFLFGLYLAGMTIGGRIQYLFIALKAIPILVILGVSYFSFSPQVYFEQPFLLSDIFSNVSLVVFALGSFEVICSITHLLENAQKNAYSIVLYSFCFVAFLYTTFQSTFAGAIGATNLISGDLMKYLFTLHFTQLPLLGSVIYSLIYCSILGTVYTILGSNSWNLFALAQDNNFPQKEVICRTNAYNLPWVSMLIKIFLAGLILLMSRNQIALQNMFVVCVSISYGLSVSAAIARNRKKERKSLVLFVLALLSCSYLIGLSFFRVIQSGISFSFLSIYLFGLLLHWYQYSVGALVTKE
jgi:amino acid transporter